MTATPSYYKLLQFKHLDVEMGDIIKTHPVQCLFIIFGVQEPTSYYWVINLKTMKIEKMIFFEKYDMIVK